MVAKMATEDFSQACDDKGVELLVDLEGFNKLKTPADFEPIADEDYRELCAKGELEAFGWWKLAKGTTGGHRTPPAEDFAFRSTMTDMDAAVKKLCTHIDSIGGVDGVVGFSQGGELALLLAEGIAGLKTKDRLKFVGTYGSEDPFLQRGKPPKSMPSNMRIMLNAGEEDKDAMHDAHTLYKTLQAAGAPEVSLLEIPKLDHHMPKHRFNMSFSYLIQFLFDSMENKPFPPPPEPYPWEVDPNEPEWMQRIPPHVRMLTAFDRIGEDGEFIIDMTIEERYKKYEEMGGEMYHPVIPPDAPEGWGQGWVNGRKWLEENTKKDTEIDRENGWIPAAVRAMDEQWERDMKAAQAQREKDLAHLE